MRFRSAGCTSITGWDSPKAPTNTSTPRSAALSSRTGLVLMGRPAPLSDDEARRFADFVRETVLRYTEHEAPDLPRL